MLSKKRIGIKEIIKKFGFPTDSVSIINTFKNDPKLIPLINNFEYSLNELVNLKETNVNWLKEFENIFLKYSDIFDPEVYMLQVGILIEKDIKCQKQLLKLLKNKKIENMSNDFISGLLCKNYETINKLKTMLSRNCISEKEINSIVNIIEQLPAGYVSNFYDNVTILESELNEIKERLSNSDVILIEDVGENIEIVSSQIFIGNENFLEKKEKAHQERYNEICKKIDMESEIKNLTPCDLKNIFRYDKLGNDIANRLFYSEDKIEQDINKTFLKAPTVNEIYAQEDILHTITSNLAFIDIDKLLLTILIAKFNTYGEDIKNFTYEEARNLKVLANKIEKSLKNKNNVVYSDRFCESFSIRQLKNKIEKLNNSYIAGVYYDEKQLNELRKDYIDGKKDVNDLTPHEFTKILQFKYNEILEMLHNNPLLIEYLIKNDILKNEYNQKSNNKDDELLKLVEKQNKIPTDQLEILLKNGKLSEKELFELYMNKNKVDLDSIHNLRERVNEDLLKEMVNSKELVDLYLQQDEDKEKFNKYRRLYTEIKIKGKTLEQKKDISDEILDQSIELLTEENIIELYNLGLLTVDTVIDYTGEASLKQLYLSSELKPIDAKRLFYEGIITEDMLKTIMQDKTIDDGRKITLLYSTFPDEEDTEIMEKLELYLKEVTENSISNYSEKQNKRKIKKKEDNDKKDEIEKLKKAYEPRSKYRLLSNIDKDYKFTYNQKDGTGIFYFPSREEYLIEKLYDKQRRPATDVATYILSKNVFEQNKTNIVQDGRVNISELYSLKKAKSYEVKRLIHTGWADAIIKYYELDDDKIYSKEQIEATKKLALQVEQSKKVIER